jgi:transcriptional regulator
MTSDWRTPALVALVLLVQASHLAFWVSRQSQTWDEGDHLYAGYRSLTHADFGLNPEHPPLAKMLAALPLLAMELKVPPLENRYLKLEAFLGGRDFVFANDADTVLFRARMSVALLTLLLGLFAFLAAREMFGTGAGLLALVLLAFDPNLLAHGALVTTDAGLSCFLLASVYAFYRYVKAPSWPRLLLVGLAAGLALATKHTGLLVLPILAALAMVEAFAPDGDHGPWSVRVRRAARLTGALVVVGLIGLVVLWAFYGFRYAARAEGLDMSPPAAAILGYTPKPYQAEILGLLARGRLLPESYLCGLADVFFMESIYRTYLLGKPYAHGVWWYFPVAFAVKSTLTFLLLPVAAAAAIVARRLAGRREVVFMAVPPVQRCRRPPRTQRRPLALRQESVLRSCRSERVMSHLELPQGTLDLLLLKTLSLGPQHGWAISERLQQVSSDQLRVQQGSIYPALHRLARRGWIKARWGTSDNNRRAKYYELTKAGRGQLEREESAWRALIAAVGQVLETA